MLQQHCEGQIRTMACDVVPMWMGCKYGTVRLAETLALRNDGTVYYGNDPDQALLSAYQHLGKDVCQHCTHCNLQNAVASN